MALSPSGTDRNDADGKNYSLDELVIVFKHLLDACTI